MIIRKDIVYAVERALELGADPHTFVIEDQGCAVDEFQRLRVYHEIQALIAFLTSINEQFQLGDVMRSEEEYRKELSKDVEALLKSKTELEATIASLQQQTKIQAPGYTPPQQLLEKIKESVAAGNAGVVAASAQVSEYELRGIAKGDYTTDIFTATEEDRLKQYYGIKPPPSDDDPF